jgi:flagellar basal body P-ring protein FlgI
MSASLTLTTLSHQVAVKDVRDPSSSLGLRYSASGSITGAKVVQTCIPTVDRPGNQFACAVRLDDFSQHETIQDIINSGEPVNIALSSGTLPIDNFTGVLVDYTFKILHPSNWVDATLNFELI